MTMEPVPARRGRPSLARKARALIAREGLFPPGSRALVMVSGGQDSLALLHRSHRRVAGRAGPGSVHALHVNHHLRGEESDADEALVVGCCARLGVELTVVHRPVDKAAGNIQESARDRQAGGGAAGRRGAGLRRGSRWGTRPTTKWRPCSTGWGATGGWRRCGHATLRPALGPPAARLPPGGDGGLLSRSWTRVRPRPGQRLSGLRADRHQGGGAARLGGGAARSGGGRLPGGRGGRERSRRCCAACSWRRGPVSGHADVADAARR